jgi:hypothetical protein
VNIEPGCANTLAHTLAHTLAEEFPELDRPTIGRVVFSLAAYLYALPQGTALGPVVEILAIASDILADEADGERTVSCIST